MHAAEVNLGLLDPDGEPRDFVPAMPIETPPDSTADSPEESDAPDAPHASAPSGSEEERRPLEVVRPESFADAAWLGDHYRHGSVIVLDVREAGPDLGRRMVDFCAGLVFGTQGVIERLELGVFALVPHGATLPNDALEQVTRADAPAS